MTGLRNRMIADMKLYGLAQEHKTSMSRPSDIWPATTIRTRSALQARSRDDFTYLVDEKHVPSSTLRTEIFGVKFLFDKTLQRPWPTLKFLRARRQVKLPVVLDREEAHRLIGLIRCPAVHMFATMMYSCGLRISEALGLQVTDIDSQRMVVVVRRQGTRTATFRSRTHARIAACLLAKLSPQSCLLVTKDGRPLMVHRVHTSSRRLSNRAASANRSPATRCGIPMRRTSWNRASTSVRFNACWDIAA